MHHQINPLAAHEANVITTRSGKRFQNAPGAAYRLRKALGLVWLLAVAVAGKSDFARWYGPRRARHAFYLIGLAGD
jgi:hypothetical protein